MSVRLPLVFVLGLMVGVAVDTARAQDQRLPGVAGIFHVAFVTSNYDAMKTFYTEKLGFPEAFTNRGRDGQPSFTYVQASRNTFIEIFPASATRQPGFSHIGVAVENLELVSTQLRQRGVVIGGARSGGGSSTVTLTDPDGHGIEITQLGADAPAQKAMDGWK